LKEELAILKMGGEDVKCGKRLIINCPGTRARSKEIGEAGVCRGERERENPRKNEEIEKMKRERERGLTNGKPFRKKKKKKKELGI
jgi:hypothetical protein